MVEECEAESKRMMEDASLELDYEKSILKMKSPFKSGFLGETGDASLLKGLASPRCDDSDSPEGVKMILTRALAQERNSLRKRGGSSQKKVKGNVGSPCDKKSRIDVPKLDLNLITSTYDDGKKPKSCIARKEPHLEVEVSKFGLENKLVHKIRSKSTGNTGKVDFIDSQKNDGETSKNKGKQPNLTLRKE